LNELPRVDQKLGQPAGDRAARDAEDGRDLFLLEAIDVVEPRGDPDLGRRAGR